MDIIIVWKSIDHVSHHVVLRLHLDCDRQYAEQAKNCLTIRPRNWKYYLLKKTRRNHLKSAGGAANNKESCIATKPQVDFILKHSNLYL